MKTIQLTQGKSTIVDDGDFIELSKYKWYAEKRSNGYYARTTINGKNFYMHRFILSLSDKSKYADHINRNTLDNRRINLRECTPVDSSCNKGKRQNTSSQYLGVCFDKSRGKFMAYVNYNKKRTYLGRFASEADAAIAYNKKAILLQKEFANLNAL